MRPIDESIEVTEELAAELGEHGYGWLRGVELVGRQVRAVIPECVGLSVAWTDEDIVFTLVATDEEMAELDALQYLDAGPCVEGLKSDEGIITGHQDLMDEETWRLFAQGTAAAGVRSTLTLPLLHDGEVTGTINLYGATDTAFEGRIDDLAHLLGAWAPGVVRNADLSFRTRTLAEQAPQRLRDGRSVSIAIGFLASRDGITLDEARGRIESAARRAGLSAAALAHKINQLNSDADPD